MVLGKDGRMNRDNENIEQTGEFTAANQRNDDDKLQQDQSVHIESGAKVSIDASDLPADSTENNDQLLEFVTRQTIEIPEDNSLETEIDNLVKQVADHPENFESSKVQSNPSSLADIAEPKLDSLLDKVVHAQAIEVPETEAPDSFEGQLDPAFEAPTSDQPSNQAGSFKFTPTEPEAHNELATEKSVPETMLDSVISPVEIVETTPAPVEIKDPVKQEPNLSNQQASDNGLLNLVFSLDKPTAEKFNQARPQNDNQADSQKSAFDIPIDFEELEIPSVEDLPPVEDKHKQAAHAIADLISQVNDEKQAHAKKQINRVEVDTSIPVDLMTDAQANEIAMQAARDTHAKQPASDVEQNQLDFILDNLQLAQQLKQKQAPKIQSHKNSTSESTPKNIAQDIINNQLIQEAKNQQILSASNESKPSKIESVVNSAREKLKQTQQNHIDDLLRIHSVNKQAADKIKSQQEAKMPQKPQVQNNSHVVQADHNAPIDLENIINNTSAPEPASVAESLVSDVTALEKQAETQDFDQVLNNALSSAGINLNKPSDVNLSNPQQAQNIQSASPAQPQMIEQNIANPVVIKQKFSKVQSFLLHAMLVILLAALSGFLVWYLGRGEI